MNSDFSSGVSMILAFAITLAIHYILFSKVSMHVTLHVLVGIALYSIFLGAFMLMFKRKKSK